MYQRGAERSDVARLEDYIRAIQLHKLLVLGITMLGLIAAYMLGSSRQETYTATASVLVRSTPSGVGDLDKFEVPNLEKEREVLQSNQIATGVAETVASTISGATAQGLLGGLSVDFRPDSDVLFVHYRNAQADTAALVANAFAAEYTETREGDAVAFFESLRQTGSEDLAALNAAIDQAYLDRADLQDQRSDIIAAGGDIQEIDAAIAVISSSASSLSGQLRATEIELREIEKQVRARRPAAEMLKPALTPSSPDGFGLRLLMAGGLFFGLAGGIIAAFLFERLDNTAREDEDVALALGRTVLGSIPRLGVAARGAGNGLIMLSTGGSARTHAAREAFRRLRSSVQFLNSTAGVNSILVTSSTPREGKSMTSANLSIALAQNGSRVVLVNADMRRPTIERLFGLDPNRPGLSEYLNHTAELNAERAPGIENLWLIPSGATTQNPGELLNSDRFEQLMKELDREGVEYVVVDTPPVLSTADAVSAARFVDGVIVVVDTERTETSDLLRVRADLERSGSNVLGAVMNRQKFKRRGLFKRRDHYVY